jgi:hypothetical protein
MSKLSIVTSLQSSVGEKANLASPTFTGLPKAPNWAVTVGGAHTIGYSVSVDHQAGNAGSVGLTITDGGNASGVFVENLRSGSYNSQEIVFKTAKGGVTLATEYLRIKSNGRIVINTAILANAVDDVAAAGAGVAVGEMYRNGSLLSVRIV